MGSAADAFLGTQGDVLDTLWDTMCALVGAPARYPARPLHAFQGGAHP